MPELVDAHLSVDQKVRKLVHQTVLHAWRRAHENVQYSTKYCTKLQKRFCDIMPLWKHGLADLDKELGLAQQHVGSEQQPSCGKGVEEHNAYEHISKPPDLSRKSRDEIQEIARKKFIRLETSTKKGTLKKAPEMLFEMLYRFESFESHECATVNLKYAIKQALVAQEKKRRMLSKYEQSNIDEDALMMAYYEDGLAEDEAELLDALNTSTLTASLPRKEQPVTLPKEDCNFYPERPDVMKPGAPAIVFGEAMKAGSSDALVEDAYEGEASESEDGVDNCCDEEDELDPTSFVGEGGEGSAASGGDLNGRGR